MRLANAYQDAMARWPTFFREPCVPKVAIGPELVVRSRGPVEVDRAGVDAKRHRHIGHPQGPTAEKVVVGGRVFAKYTLGGVRRMLGLAHLHEMTVEEYLHSNIAGRTELLGGVVYDVLPRNAPHRYAVRKLGVALHSLNGRCIVQVRDVVAVPDWKGKDTPEVDIAIITDKFYEPAPTSADAVALIEVSDTTYECDRRYKIPLYVAAGVPAGLPVRRLPLRVHR